jgi:hypothetical protein
MFDRLKNALAHPPSPPVIGDDAVVAWAAERLLRHRALPGGAYSLSGRLHDKAFRAECTPSTRSYIVGLELMAKTDLGLPPAGSVIVMNRALKRTLEAQANGLFAKATQSLQTRAEDMPEEIRWLTLYRDAGWAGPDERFWSRYAVLTDVPELAERWLDATALGLLQERAAEDPVTDSPLLLMLTRGKAYMRAQVTASTGSAEALDLFEHLCGRALALAPRDDPGP